MSRIRSHFIVYNIDTYLVVLGATNMATYLACKPLAVDATGPREGKEMSEKKHQVIHVLNTTIESTGIISGCMSRYIFLTCLQSVNKIVAAHSLASKLPLPR